MATGNLSIEAQTRYAFMAKLLSRDFPPPARIVELGSAPGDQIAHLAKIGYEATSVDIHVSSDAWGHGEEGRMDKLLADAGVTDIEWNLEQTPYPLDEGAFDAVLMTEVYEHLRDYPVKSLQEVRRILRPGGRLYFTTPNSAYVINRLRLLAGKNVSSSLPDWIGGVPHARHAREYTFGEVRDLMTYAGLDVVSATSHHFYLDSGRQGVISSAGKQLVSRLGGLRPSLGPSIIVVAERPQSD
jgi:SAM-dependent methyltransferase